MYDKSRDVQDNDNIIDKMLGDLTSYTSRTFEVEKFGHRWVFKAIGSGDHVQVIADSVGPADRIARLFKLEIVTLCKALVTVDGVALDDKEKTYLFNNVAPVVVDELADAYEVFRSNNEKEIKQAAGKADGQADDEPVQGPAPEPVQAEKPAKRRKASQASSGDMPSLSDVPPPPSFSPTNV